VTAQENTETRSAKGKAAYVATEQPNGDKDEDVDYTLPENYTVQKYVSHKPTQKKHAGGFELLTRWKGFGESDDTYKPLLNQLGDNPAIVKSYIMTINTSEAENIKAIIKDIAALLPEATVQMFV
jgi:hypothetical protein